jgi:hypothetical protein
MKRGSFLISMKRGYRLGLELLMNSLIQIVPFALWILPLLLPFYFYFCLPGCLCCQMGRRIWRVGLNICAATMQARGKLPAWALQS